MKAPFRVFMTRDTQTPEIVTQTPPGPLLDASSKVASEALEEAAGYAAMPERIVLGSWLEALDTPESEAALIRLCRLLPSRTTTLDPKTLQAVDLILVPGSDDGARVICNAILDGSLPADPQLLFRLGDHCGTDDQGREPELDDLVDQVRLQIIKHACGPLGLGPASTQQRVAIEDHVMDLFNRDQHKSSPLKLDALLWTAAACTRRFRRWLSTLPMQLSMPLRSRLSPEHCRTPLLGWLKVPMLRRTVLRHLDQYHGPQVDAILQQASLLRSPLLALSVKATGLGPAFKGDTEVMCRSAQPGLVDWIEATESSPATRCTRLEACCSLPEPLARIRAVSTISRARPAPGTQRLQALQAFLDDDIGSIRRLTNLLVCGERDKVSRAWFRENAGRLNPVSTMAIIRHQARRDLGVFIQKIGTLQEQDVHAIGAAHCKHDPAGFRRRLDTVLDGSDHQASLVAIRLICRLGIARDHLDRLIHCANGSAHHVAPAAIAALGQVRDPQAESVVVDAVNHASPRMRANAIEAIAASPRRTAMPMGTGRFQELLESHANEDSARPRANAIKALVNLAPSVGYRKLRMMLADDRPEHRSSAVWVTRSLRLDQQEDRLLDLATNDPVDSIRHDARDALALLRRPGVPQVQLEGARP